MVVNFIMTVNRLETLLISNVQSQRVKRDQKVVKAEKRNDWLKRKMKLNVVHGVKHQSVKRSHQKHLKVKQNHFQQPLAKRTNEKKKRKESISIQSLLVSLVEPKSPEMVNIHGSV